MRFALVVLVFSGCMNPDEIFPLHGAVTSVDPVEGQVVRLLRQIQPGGAPCQSSQGTLFKEAQADTEGTYGFEVFRVEARSLSGSDTFCFRIDASFPSGSAAWTDLGTPGAELTLAPLFDWRPGLSLDAGVLHFEPPVPWPADLEPVLSEGRWFLGMQLTHRAQVVTEDGGVLWQADDRFQVSDGVLRVFHAKREPLVVDDVRLEDFAGTLSLSASLFDPDQLPRGLSYFQNKPPTGMRGGERLSLRGNRVPVSRGLACPALATPCPLTDGDLTEVDAGMINEVPLELTRPIMLSAVVLRGAEVGSGLINVVLTQEDGGVAMEVAKTVPASTFTLFSNTESAPPFIQLSDGGFASIRRGFVVIPLDAGVPISRVTLQFPAGLARIQEVSFFE